MNTLLLPPEAPAAVATELKGLPRMCLPSSVTEMRYVPEIGDVRGPVDAHGEGHAARAQALAGAVGGDEREGRGAPQVLHAQPIASGVARSGIRAVLHRTRCQAKSRQAAPLAIQGSDAARF
eukprot:1145188-Pleurochrysis_carterae.AAC.1